MSKSQLEEPQISIILPTYNESKTILNILKGIRENLPKEIFAETIVIDDNSPDGTGILSKIMSKISKRLLIIQLMLSTEKQKVDYPQQY